MLATRATTLQGKHPYLVTPVKAVSTAVALAVVRAVYVRPERVPKTPRVLVPHAPVAHTPMKVRTPAQPVMLVRTVPRDRRPAHLVQKESTRDNREAPPAMSVRRVSTARLRSLNRAVSVLQADTRATPGNWTVTNVQTAPPPAKGQRSAQFVLPAVT